MNAKEIQAEAGFSNSREIGQFLGRMEDSQERGPRARPEKSALRKNRRKNHGNFFRQMDGSACPGGPDECPNADSLLTKLPRNQASWPKMNASFWIAPSTLCFLR